MKQGNTYKTLINNYCTMRIQVQSNEYVLYMYMCMAQELEMQARAHGLAIGGSSALCSTELVACGIKEEPVSYTSCSSELYARSHLSSPDHSRPTTLDLNNGTISYSDSTTEETGPGLYASHKEPSVKLDDMFLENTLSPVGTSNLLLSSGSPTHSNNSSRRSSTSTEEQDKGC